MSGWMEVQHNSLRLMPSKIIACAHPGKMGDTLWALPSVRALCEKHDAVCDFYTSDYCLPLKDLVEYQPYIRQMIVPAGYTITSMDCGCQPAEMPIDPRGYAAVYQMGFHGVPFGCIGGYIAEKAGLPRAVGERVEYAVPPHGLGFGPRGYIVLAPRGETSYAPLMREFAKRSPFPTVEIGAIGQAVIPTDEEHFDLTCASMLRMASIISGARAFIGLMSGPLVIANGFPVVKKIVPHNGRSWDMSHVMYSDNHHYEIEPTVERLLGIVGKSFES